MKIRKGAIFDWNQQLLSHDPRLWHEPEKFIPERFLPGFDNHGETFVKCLPFF
jgi:cytochrome P450